MENKKRISRECIPEILFVLLVFGFYFMWARIQPLNAAPDEGMRYLVPQYIYNHGRLPAGDDPEIMNKIWGNSYGFNPILSFILSAGLMKLVSFVSAKPFALLLAARMVSVLFGTGTAFLALQIGKKLFDKPRAWLLAFFVAFLPEMAFISSYVNCDAMAVFSTGMILYFWICGMEDEWSVKSCIGLALGVSLCTHSYYNAYGFILCSVFFFGITLLLTVSRKKDWKLFLRKGLLVTVIVLFLIGWWFIRNQVLYGDFTGRKAIALCTETHAMKGFRPSERETPVRIGLGFWEMLTKGYPGTGASWLDMTIRTFVGRFGFVSVLMQPWMEDVFLWFIGIGYALSWLHPGKVFRIREKNVWSRRGILNWCLLLSMIIPVLLSMYYSYTSDYQPQGRYCIPMLLPLAYFMMIGYGNLLDLFKEHSGIRCVVCYGACILLAGLSIYVYFTIFWPAYRNTPFSIGAFLGGGI
ncbi:MAG: glycosyltransferase family 39 protein [Blautia sp.]|nr:glycosyltransferase family 39 protein [Blautia sp.]